MTPPDPAGAAPDGTGPPELHAFDTGAEIPLDATPEQVWQAIATGPGVNSWFMGRTAIEPAIGGVFSRTVPGHPDPPAEDAPRQNTTAGTVTAWDPPRRFGYRTAAGPDGSFMAFEYLIEGRASGGTVLRMVHSGLLGADWADQYDAMAKGDPMYLRKLAVYLRHFPGRTSSYDLFEPGPRVPDPRRAWSAFGAALGVREPVRPGVRGRVSVPGVEPAGALVEFALEPHFLGARTATGIYMFVHGYRDRVVVEYHHFGAGAQPAPDRAGAAWRAWLTRTLG